MKKIITNNLKGFIMSKNFEIFYVTDCCGSYCESDSQICPDCYEHCEVIEDRVDYEDSESVHFQASLDFYGAG